PGSPVYLGTVTPVSTAALPSGRWAAHVTRDAPLWERCGRRVPPCGERARPGVGERGGGHGATGGGEPLRAVLRGLAAWPRDPGSPALGKPGAVRRTSAWVVGSDLIGAATRS